MTTPKAKLYQIYQFGEGLKFQTEAVVNTLKEEDADVLPGSTAFFKPTHSVQFRCTLNLPNGTTVVSDLFPRKKDAEQHASKQALEQVTVNAQSEFSKLHASLRAMAELIRMRAMINVQMAKSPEVLTPDEKWDNLRSRIAVIFSEKNVQAYYPLRQHFKAAFKREGSRHGQVPISAIVTLDAKIHSLCKVIDRKAETDPAYAMALLCKAASKIPSIKTDMGNLSLSREEPFSADLVKEILATMAFSEEPGQKSDTSVEFSVVHIPCTSDVPAFAAKLVVKPEDYYLDVIARELGIKDGGRVLFSRPIGKTHPSMRLYWSASKHLPQLQGGDSDFVNLTGGVKANSQVADEDLRRYSVRKQEEESCGLHAAQNVRASLLMGYAVYGEVILAAVGGDWSSYGKLYSVDITSSTFSRMLLQRFPQGSYKVSRGAILTIKLPNVFSSRSQWKGMPPRGLLIEFCQHHRLPDPVFTLTATGSLSNDPAPLQEELDNRPCEGCDARNDDESNAAAMRGGPFTCKVRVEWQKGSVLEFESDGPYRNRHDAQQSAALKALRQFESWFENCVNGHYEPILADRTEGTLDKDQLIVDCDDVRPAIESRGECWDPADEQFFGSHAVEDSSQTDKMPPSGSMVTVRYTVRSYPDADGESSILLEKHDKLEFELGSGAVIGVLDALVMKMSVGETAYFVTSPPPRGLLSALSYDLGEKNELFSRGIERIRYTVQLVKYVEAPEERMEAAHFKPSLSKQRVEYALQIIEKLQAKRLIDLGCGSGSLLESLLDQPTQLKELIGVDISHKSLIRAAKLLTLKLKSEKIPSKESLEKIDLYEGSITDFDRQFGGADVATCIEVVEHMDPEPLEKFGSTILGMLQPQVLIVSTPNFEYNPILQGLPWDSSTNSLISPVEDLDRSISHDEQVSVGKRIRLSEHGSAGGNNDNSLRSVKFRNEDHRFEWTRAEFRVWATNMADAYSYDVIFSGVGGSGEDEGPGYASQIALFSRRKQLTQAASPQQQHILSNGCQHSQLLSNGCQHSRGTTLAQDEGHVKLWNWASSAQQDAV